MKFPSIFYLLLSTIVLVSCSPESKKGEKENTIDKTETGARIVKKYWKDGSIKTEMAVLGKERHGLSKTYFEGGKLHQEVNYKHNVKHGQAKMYYKNGNLFQETMYEDGIIHGYRKKYRSNGKLMSHTLYDHEKPCAGLKEYLLNGELKKKYPKILMTTSDKILSNNKYIIEIRMSDKAKHVEYYMGKLKNGCFGDGIVSMSTTSPGVLKLKYTILPGTFIMEQLDIIAVVKTKLGGKYVTSRTFNVSAENRGF